MMSPSCSIDLVGNERWEKRMSDIALFISASVAGILTWVIILVFKRLKRMGKRIRRSVFVAVVTTSMTVCGLVIGLAVNSGVVLAIVFALSFATWGAMISVFVSLVLYRSRLPK